MKWIFGAARKSAAGQKQQPTPELLRKIASLNEMNAQAAQTDVHQDIYQARLQQKMGRTGWALYSIALVLACFLGWATFAKLDEVTSSTGKIIPTSREQVVQSMEPGVLAEIMVAEGDIVEQGQPLLRIDDVRVGATVMESQSRIDALTLAAARLRAESQNVEFLVPAAMAKRNPVMVQSERSTFAARKRTLAFAMQAQNDMLRLAQDELKMTAPMAAEGLVSDLDVMRIQRSIVEIKGNLAGLQSSYRADAAAELAKIEGELGAQSATLVGRQDSLRRTILTAPKRGIVKNIRTNTVGGVVQSGQDLLEIVPIDDVLLVEVRIRPSDIAFLHAGLPAVVKISAYDSAIYGWLEGTVMQIGADTLRDEVKRDETYYRALVRTNASALKGVNGQTLPIIPGMLAQVDIKTGQKSVLSYLFKPILRAREALRER